MLALRRHAPEMLPLQARPAVSKPVLLPQHDEAALAPAEGLLKEQPPAPQVALQLLVALST